MKKDIEIPEVKDVHVAAIPEKDEPDVWNIYIINNQLEMIEGVMVTSKGYDDQVNGAKTTTSVLRHVLGDIPAKTAAKIEPITPEVFHLNNEYWITFFSGNKLMEKKFIFGSHVIDEALLEDVPVINKKGVWIK